MQEVMTSKKSQMETLQANAANVDSSDGSSSCSFEIGWGSDKNRIAFEQEWNQLCVQMQMQEKLVAECFTQKKLAAIVEFDLHQRPEDSSGKLLCPKAADPILKAHERA